LHLNISGNNLEPLASPDVIEHVTARWSFLYYQPLSRTMAQDILAHVLDI